MNKKTGLCGMSRVTLEDVANACGVSKATASYVLNNKPASYGLSAVTVRRVLDVSRRLNYRPDAVARLLESQKRSILKICVFSPWLHSQFSDFMVQISAAIESAMHKQKLHVEYQLYRNGELKKILKSKTCRKYDACVILGTSMADDQFLDKNIEDFRNVILVNRKHEIYPSVFGNDFDICEKVGKKLVASGYYDRYILCRNLNSSARVQMRLNGYKKSFAEAENFTVQESVIPQDIKEYDYIKQLLDNRSSERSCYIFTHYRPAAAMLNAALRNGISVPDELGIVAYDQHSLLKNFLNMQLTTVEPRIFDMMTAALELARAMKSGEELKSIKIEAEIIAGNTAVIK